MGLGLGEQLSVHCHQSEQILFARQHLLSKLWIVEVNAAPRSQIFCEPIRPKRRIDRNPLGVVEVLVARQAAVDRLPHQISERELLVCALPGVGEMHRRSVSRVRAVVQFAAKMKPPSERDVRSLEIDFEKSIRKLAGTALFLFHPSGVGLPGVLIGFAQAQTSNTRR